MVPEGRLTIGRRLPTCPTKSSRRGKKGMNSSTKMSLAHRKNSRTKVKVRETICMRWGALLIATAISLHAESGSLTIHMILHAVGEERYEIAAGDSGLTLNSTFEYSDRGTKRSTAVTLRMTSDYTPEGLEVKGGAVRTVTLAGATATVQEDQNQRSVAAPARYFTIFGASPFAVQMAMMRYWVAHGKPAELPVLHASE